MRPGPTADLGTAITSRLPFAEMVATELLAADRAAAESAARTDLVSGLTGMMARGVLMPAPDGIFAEGVPAVRAALGRDSLNATSRVEWTPVRVGISGDGSHGFTLGYMTTMRADGTRIPGKYLAYWVREDDAWRVAAYKRGRRPEGEVSLEPLKPLVPEQLVPPAADPAVLSEHASSLAQAERDFSNDAQSIGLERAFAFYGSPDAMNLGGPASAAFVIGNTNIARAVGAGTPATSSPVAWGPDHRVIVASSGDLGVTFGFIRRNPAPGTQASAIPGTGTPFFTIWRRATPGAPWRYIAE